MQEDVYKRQVELYTSTLKDIFYVSPIMLIPPVLVIIMVIKKIPALPGLIAVAFLGLSLIHI